MFLGDTGSHTIFDRLRLLHLRENPHHFIADLLHLSNELRALGVKFLNVGGDLGPLSSELVGGADIDFHDERFLVDLAHLSIRLGLDGGGGAGEAPELLIGGGELSLESEA
nr:hypothetical protein Itr_chr07CG03380 [Ipomoea trifida]